MMLRTRLKLMAPLLAAGLVAAACTSDGGQDNDAGAPAAPGTYPRNETLYTSGSQWGPPASWNPIRGFGEATGLNGLVYETLFQFDPWEVQLTPWLAETGSWTSDTVYELTLREGITWSDGEPMTSEDVVFTFELGQVPGVPYANLWNWLESAEAVDDRTVRFTFSDPRAQEWENNLYSRKIVPEHIWSAMSDEDVVSSANENPIGSGPYTYLTHDQDRMVWQKRDGWWATAALDLDVKPRYIVDIVNSSNEVALGLLLQGDLDLSNNFLPGINRIIDGDFGIASYYPEAPYMLSANTAVLIPNNTREPMDDPAFRQALAYSIDTTRIVEGVYGNIVAPSNATGMLPVWDDYVDQGVVGELGFSYDPERAADILADAGYEDTNGDGFVETPDGDEIQLDLIVPAGWTDWMESIRVISETTQAVGLNIVPSFPDAGALDDARTAGDFDLMINNWTGLSNTPWTYYNYIYQLPVNDDQPSANFERHENEEAWALVEELARTRSDDVDAMREVLSQLQEITLTDMPVIPMWYNGLWAQYNTAEWTNWPSAAADAPHHFPSTWNTLWEMGSIYMLTELEPA